ncbi:MAG TPA: MarR family winged helix-turn-helix transcriptional regulator [Caldimonas sp.]|jgi:DNA-binding MarR family transcriptional regulator|nr:MarR family winged helix-turn-helix transcriptional regulator [Caldimonas sp.]HEX2542024.1 MarR family winged helix-turn-helix transcriptional regulator [Caldimonas sp.]
MASRSRPRTTTGRDRTQAHDEAARQVLRQFRQVFNAVKTHFQQVERKVGLGGAQVWALSVIQKSPGIGVGALAAAMNIHQSTASNLVRALVERELVTVSRDPDDRRVVQLKLLAKGARLLRRTPGPYAGVLPEALAALDARTLKRIQTDLAKLIDVLAVDDRSGEIPLAEL